LRPAAAPAVTPHAMPSKGEAQKKREAERRAPATVRVLALDLAVREAFEAGLPADQIANAVSGVVFGRRLVRCPPYEIARELDPHAVVPPAIPDGLRKTARRQRRSTRAR
jgi:hypothetical protein